MKTTNNTNINLSTEIMSEIEKVASTFGVDSIVIGKHVTDGGNGTLVTIYDTEDNFLFSFDTADLVAF
jgi:predicted SPOUT superfamily RNA methylase MTH1